MPGETTPGAVPYALDNDPRALWPTTSHQLATRVAELTGDYHARGVVAPATSVGAGFGQVLGWSASWELDQPWSYGGGVFTYTGPTRRFLITLQLMMSAGQPLLSNAFLGTVPGTWDRESTWSSGVGPDGAATHTHHLSMVGTMGPDNVTTIVAAASADITVAVTGHIELSSL